MKYVFLSFLRLHHNNFLSLNQVYDSPPIHTIHFVDTQAVVGMYVQECGMRNNGSRKRYQSIYRLFCGDAINNTIITQS